MFDSSLLSELPNKPAVYVLYGGKGRNRYRAYVGIANKLKQRIDQHLIKRDSSVATGTSVATLNSDYVTEIEWWEHPRFSNRDFLVAAEKVAFDIFEPTLRSRGNIPKTSLELYNQADFRKEMQKLFENKPNGKLVIPTLQDAIARIEQLEKKVVKLEKRLE